MRVARTVVLCITLLCLAACGAESGATSAIQPTTAEPTAIEVSPTPAPDLTLSSRSFRMGTAGFIPSGFPEPTEAQWRAFFATGAGGYGDLFGVHINYAAPKNDAGVPEQVQLAVEQVTGTEVYVAFGVNPEGGTFTEAAGQELVEVAVATAREVQPTYLSLGVESNSLFLRQGHTYDLYVQVARRAYEEIKAVSPDTRVMNNFQLERMKGATALTGEGSEPHWHLIHQLEDRLDVVSFTVYPFLNYRSVREIPGDYLADIRQHTELPLMITETGWPSEPTASGVEGSEQEQIDYIMKLAEQADELGVEAVIWVFPHDASFDLAGGIFDHISLRHNDGSPKPAFDYWRALQALPLEGGG